MIDKHIESKVMIITGAAKGIGRAIANLFAANGYKVLINYCSSDEDAKELGTELAKKGCEFCLYKANITKRREVDEMVAFCVNEFGTVDLLINNAGICESKLFTDISEEDWDHMMDVNLKGAFNCTQSVMETMVSNKQGKIINISSIWGMVGASCEVHYSTAKAGMIGFTKALAKELAPSNIQVNCIAPGIIETDMIKSFTNEEIDMMKEEIPLGDLGQVQDIAECAWYLASAGGDYMTGQVLSPNGGMVI